MKWINHLAIAGATTALVSPALVPVALLGSTDGMVSTAPARHHSATVKR